MANMNVRTPRFMPDNISYFLSRGVAQNGNFDVTDSGGVFQGIQTGTEAELFDMYPLNKVDFDTSANDTDHVLITLNMQGLNQQSFVAILNHNLNSAEGKIRLFTGNIASDVTAVDAGNAEVGDANWSDMNVTEVVNADTITTGASNTSVVVEPATDGSTIFKFDVSTNQYWGIQFEGADGGSGADTDETWGGTDFFLGCVIVGELYDSVRSPNLELTRSIIFDKVKVLESIGGQRFSNMSSHGRTATSTSKSPFTTASNNHATYGGRMAYDLTFSYINNTDMMPNEYDTLQTTDDAVVQDIWNKTNGPHIPFIFSIDKDSQGNDAESEHILARFGQDSLDMEQVAFDLWNISMRIEEEF